MIQKIIKQLRDISPLVAAFMLANILNFAFNTYLARSLSVENYGFIALINTFWTILLVGSGAIMQVTSYQVARAAQDDSSSISAYRITRSLVRRVAAILSIGWLAISPLLVQFFHAPNLFSVMIFAPMIWLGLLTGTHRGYIQGRLRFSQVGSLFLIEAISKLFFAIAFVVCLLGPWAYLSLPLSVAVAWAAAIIAVRKHLPQQVEPNAQPQAFPWSFFGGNILTSLAAMAFLSIDLLLAKHYLNATQAGHYAVLSLVGKMVYFLGSILNTFLLPMLGNAEANGANQRHVFWRVYGLAGAMSLVGFGVLGLFGATIVPILFGSNSRIILPQLIPYCAGIALFTMANVVVIYHLAKRHYLFPIVSVLGAMLIAIQIVMSHDSVAAIANSVFVAGLASFIAITLADLAMAHGQSYRRPLRRIPELFTRRPSVVKSLEKRRILVLNWRDTRHAQGGGAEVYVHELARRWHEVGHEVTLFCGNDGISPRHEVIDGINIIRRGSFSFVYVWAFIYYIARFRGQFDVIVDCHNGIPFFAPLYAREPVYCVVHHVHQDVFSRFLSKPQAVVAKFLEAVAMPWVYRHCEFLTVSKSSKDAMVEELGIKSASINIIHNGVDLELLVPGKKAVVPTVLYVGRLKTYKSVDVLIRAFAKVTSSHPTARLKIAGTGDDLDRLKALARELKIVGKVKFLGFISESQKIQLMQEAWVFVNPSYAEGWGITTIEANACGTPVIASDVAGLRDSVKAPTAGYLVPYGDVKGFSRKILLVLDNQERRQALSTNANNWAKKFSWQESATTFLERIS